MIQRNMRARNFGLRSRSIVMAAKNALRERGGSFATVADNAKRFEHFADYELSTYGVKLLEYVEKEHISVYAKHLSGLVKESVISLSTAKNRLSAVNTVMEQARLNRDVWVQPSDYFDKRSYIRTENRAISDTQEKHVRSQLSNHKYADRLLGIQGLTRHMGLRPKEAALINAHMTLSEAEKTGFVTIKLGTKGGKSRIVEIRNDLQIKALRQAAQAQDKDRSMIPSEMSWAQWERYGLKVVRSCGEPGWYGGRHRFAIERYAEHVGVLPPVALGMAHGHMHIKHISDELGITYQTAKKIDQNARLLVSRELGHERVQASNAYLG